MSRLQIFKSNKVIAHRLYRCLSNTSQHAQHKRNALPDSKIKKHLKTMTPFQRLLSTRHFASLFTISNNVLLFRQMNTFKDNIN